MPRPYLLSLVAQPLDAAAFAPFGDVIAAGEGGNAVNGAGGNAVNGAGGNAVNGAGGNAVNGGSAQRLVAVPELDLVRDGGHAVLALYLAQARTLPFDAIEMERHQLSDQVFLPLAGRRRCILLVAPAGAPPAPEACRVFVSDGAQGVRLRAGTWHHGLLALDDGPWAVLERRAGDGTIDCELHRFAAPLRLHLL